MYARTAIGIVFGALPFVGMAQPVTDRAGPDKAGPPRPSNVIVHVLDANRDGTIDAGEIARAPAALKTLDRNGDGKLTNDELMPRGQDFGRACEHAEPGGDGPAQNMPPRPPQGMSHPGGALTVDNQTIKTSGKSYASHVDDISAVYVCHDGKALLTQTKIATSGNSSSQEGSRAFGLNAAVLADTDSRIAILGGWIRTGGDGANGVFAAGSGTEICLSNVTINTAGCNGHGAMAVQGGKLTLREVDITTLRDHGAALAAGRDGGTIIASRTTCTTAGRDSPAVYSSGRVVASNSTFTATGSEAVVIEGGNSADLTDTLLTGSKGCGVMLSSDSAGTRDAKESRFTMRRGALTAKEGPLFYVTDGQGVITLSRARLAAASGVLLKAAASCQDHSEPHCAHAVLAAEAERLNGDVLCENGGSAVEISLTKNTLLTGQVTGASILLDASSSWFVTADSVIRTLTNPKGLRDGLFTNIAGNGHTVRYDAALPANAWLGGRTYRLGNGGSLQPITP